MRERGKEYSKRERERERDRGGRHTQTHTHTERGGVVYLSPTLFFDEERLMYNVNVVYNYIT